MAKVYRVAAENLLARDESSVANGTEPLREMQAMDSSLCLVGDAHNLPDVRDVPHADAPLPRRKRYLAIHEGQAAVINYLTGKKLKTFVATIPDDANICFIDVPEGKEPHLVHLSAGDAIVGK